VTDQERRLLEIRQLQVADQALALADDAMDLHLDALRASIVEHGFYPTLAGLQIELARKDQGQVVSLATNALMRLVRVLPARTSPPGGTDG
jgi:hypothetical protein